MLNLGMCVCFRKTVPINYYITRLKYGTNYLIPEFNPLILHASTPNDIYWWPIRDCNSRISAFKYLESSYWKKLSFKDKVKAIIYKI